MDDFGRVRFVGPSARSYADALGVRVEVECEIDGRFPVEKGAIGFAADRPNRCSSCGKRPGQWQPEVGAPRDELTLEECRECGAAWTGRIGTTRR